MAIFRFNLDLSTNGNVEVVDLSPQITRRLKQLRDEPAAAPLLQGPALLNLFVIGSTAALTTIEFETGLVKHDLPALLQRIIPDDARYEHEATWHDDNGHSHLRASLIGPSLSVPVQDGRLLTGEYQQIVLLELDTRSRRRTIVATLMA